MITIKEPVGRLIVLAHNQKNMIAQSHIEQSVEDLIDIITIRLLTKSVAAVSESVLEKIFDLRFEVIEWLDAEKATISDFQSVINQAIVHNLGLNEPFELTKMVVIVLNSYDKILTSVIEKVGLEPFNQMIQNEKPSYKAIELISRHPSPPIQYLKKWVDASLKIEFGLIVADLVLTKQILFESHRINELIVFLKDTMVQYGAYSIFTNFWEPDENDTSKMTHLMEILAATIELEHKMGYKTTQNQLFNLIHR
jgi:hypothetical protein